MDHETEVELKEARLAIPENAETANAAGQGGHAGRHPASRFLKTRRLRKPFRNLLKASDCLALLRAQGNPGGESYSLPRVFALITLKSKQSLDASVRAGERQHCRTRTAWPQIRRSRSRFQKTCLPNGGRKVVGGGGLSTLFAAVIQPFQL